VLPDREKYAFVAPPHYANLPFVTMFRSLNYVNAYLTTLAAAMDHLEIRLFWRRLSDVVDMGGFMVD
jgi:hypothetical protein